MVNVATRAQVVRQTIESELADSFAGALTPRPFTVRPMLPFGITELDAATGGVPVGAVTELAGAGSTGKTGAAMQVIAGAMRAGKVCAWVDASDSFDPETAAANGVLLPQMLWVRCGGAPAAAVLSQQKRSMLKAGTAEQSTPVTRGRCSSHPRGEEQGLDEAVSGLFQAAGKAAANTAFTPPRDPAGTTADTLLKERYWPAGSRTGMHSTRNRQKLGTPGAPNLPLSPYKRAKAEPHPAFRPVPRSEQVASDRQGGRNLQGVAVHGSREQISGSPVMPAVHAVQSMGKPVAEHRPWACLDQALRAADLLLQGGGFAVIVLDLGSVAPEHVLRIPAATWFRFRAVAEANGTAFLLLSQAACSQSSAGLMLFCKPAVFRLAGGTVVESVCYQSEVARQRFRESSRKPYAAPHKSPQSTWQASSYAVPQTVYDSDIHAVPETKLHVVAKHEQPSSTARPYAALLAWKTACSPQGDLAGGVYP